MALSRRVFLSLIGLIPFFAVRLGRASGAGEDVPAANDDIVVVRGWVLRRDDLDRLSPR
jgi:hypothetical protein